MIGESASKAIEQSKALIRNSWEYYKLQLFAQAATVISILVKVAIIGGVSMIALLFFSIALAQYFGELLDDVTLGYVATGGILLLIALILYCSRTCIENKIVRKLSKNLFEE